MHSKDLKVARELGYLFQMNAAEVTTPHKFVIARTAAEMGCSGGDGEEASAKWLHNKICSLKPGTVLMVFLGPLRQKHT